jgi:predicted lipid-binding transport protein (Tim44 family)
VSSDQPHRPPEPDVPDPVPTGQAPTGQVEAGQDPEPAAAPGRREGGLAGALLLYTALRLGLVAAITALLALFMPFIVALLFAIIVQLPLSWLLFAEPRRRVNQALAASTSHRRAERQRLQAALSGDDAAARSDPHQG